MVTGRSAAEHVVGGRGARMRRWSETKKECGAERVRPCRQERCASVLSQSPRSWSTVSYLRACNPRLAPLWLRRPLFSSQKSSPSGFRVLCLGPDSHIWFLCSSIAYCLLGGTARSLRQSEAAALPPTLRHSRPACPPPALQASVHVARLTTPLHFPITPLSSPRTRSHAKLPRPAPP